MTHAALTADELRATFVCVAERMQDNTELLTEADRVVGDGDHGIGMARGFRAIRTQLDGAGFETPAEVLRTVGQALLGSVGGAAGVVFGTLFIAGAEGLGDRATFDAEALRTMLVDGLAGVQARGKAAPGDKTMVDALAPAAASAKELGSVPLDELLRAVAEAAERGVEETKQMEARIGKAKSLGARALGHPDPGALSVSLILTSMAACFASPTDQAGPHVSRTLDDY